MKEIEVNNGKDTHVESLENQILRESDWEEANTIEEYFLLWERYISELTVKEKELITLKESYNQLEQEIIDSTDFKELYGKNNETVRRNHVRNELKDMVDKKHDLELRISYLKRKSEYVKELMRMQRALLNISEM